MNQADDDPLDTTVAGRQTFEAVKETFCSDGWNTYELHSQQNPSAPESTVFTLKRDDISIYSDSHPTKLLPLGQNLTVYVSSPSHEEAKYFHIRNFFMETLVGVNICDDTTFCPTDADCNHVDFSCTCHAGTQNEGDFTTFYP